ncbi:hypothetical protein Tco_1017920 [Tanacetum coccineum]|uniref:Uncharacterized protein n=1 Tax=Tanacetum coccineum TaxID=301880 RepID=A0ABQ5FSW0_9ASTR
MRPLNLPGPFLHQVCPFPITTRHLLWPPTSYLHRRTLCFHRPVILECLLIGSARSKESQSSHMNIWNVLLMKWSKPSILTYNVSRPLPLGGPPGQVTIQTEFFFNKDLEYLRFGHKDDRLALSITKMKDVFYPHVGLEQIVPDLMWAEEEYMYDISASYAISHWWFKRQQFYIDRHSADTNRRAIVRTHMRILSVVRIEVFSLYGYDYMKKIVLRRADNQEYTIAESDFKDLYPSDFEDLYLLNLQGHLNHLPPKDKKILSTAVNLWIRNLVIRKRVKRLLARHRELPDSAELSHPQTGPRRNTCPRA